VTPKPKSKPKPPVVTTGQLPFTGLSLVTTSVLGFALIALGILLRRRERQSS
jgi:LPXTG-motif cell wall-anchored protein